MNVELLREFFGWMTLINLVAYMLTASICILMKDVMVTFTGKLFGVDDARSKTVTYWYVGMYKLFFLVFNLVPWLALVIMTK